jgi:hypothetical protein
MYLSLDGGSTKVYTGPKKGKFYINKKGSKVYLNRKMLEDEVPYKNKKKPAKPAKSAKPKKMAETVVMN